MQLAFSPRRCPILVDWSIFSPFVVDTFVNYCGQVARTVGASAKEKPGIAGRDQLIRRLAAAGYRQREIAEKAGLERSWVSRIVNGNVLKAQEPTINTILPAEEMVKLQEENNKTKIELASLREELVQAKQRAAALAGKEPVQANPQKTPFKAPDFTQKVVDYLFCKVGALWGILMVISAKQKPVRL